jgi:hypothetical protein
MGGRGRIGEWLSIARRGGRALEGVTQPHPAWKAGKSVLNRLPPRNASLKRCAGKLQEPPLSDVGRKKWNRDSG